MAAGVGSFVKPSFLLWSVFAIEVTSNAPAVLIGYAVSRLHCWCSWETQSPLSDLHSHRMFLPFSKPALFFCLALWVISYYIDDPPIYQDRVCCPTGRRGLWNRTVICLVLHSLAHSWAQTGYSICCSDKSLVNGRDRFEIISKHHFVYGTADCMDACCFLPGPACGPLQHKA